MNNAMKVGGKNKKTTYRIDRSFIHASVKLRRLEVTIDVSVTLSQERRRPDGAATQGQLFRHGESVDHIRRIHQLREDQGASGGRLDECERERNKGDFLRDCARIRIHS